MSEKEETYLLSAEIKKQIDQWLTKYPDDQRQSGVLQALHFVQDAEGGITTPMMDAIADHIGMPKIHVYEVATFYGMYHLEPAGKNKIYLCTNISCDLCGFQEIRDHIQKKLEIGFGETTKDGKFSLHAVECLAACRNAPAMQVNKDYFENLTPEKINQVLDSLE